MNYSEIQIEDLRQMILDNSIDPSKLSVDDCADILYYEVEKEKPSEVVIDYCLKFIKTTEEYKSIKVPSPKTFFKNVRDKNNIFYSKRIFKIVATVAAIIILVPSISFLSVYAIKAIQEIIYNWQQESLHIYSSEDINHEKTSDETIGNDDNEVETETDYTYDDISSIPIEIKNLIPQNLYDMYGFIYCRYKENSTYTICNFMLSSQALLRISIFESKDIQSCYDFELPKNEDSKYEYKSSNNIQYYIFENNKILTAVSNKADIIVSISGLIEIEEMKKIIDMIDIPNHLP